MLDINTLLPLFQMMNKGGGNNNMNNLEPLLNAFKNNTAPNPGSPSGNPNGENPGDASGNNDIMKMLPLLMQLMNRNNPASAGNSAPAPAASSPARDPLEPIRNIGNNSINSMLFNMMNRK